jgi:response regulator RpfG family c-di-GMP phosphodiesterase
VHYALLHHTKAGFGYPKAQSKPPLRGIDLVSVASAFAGLVAPRSYRPQPYNPRGAVDQLLEEANKGVFDPRAVRVLIHCLRGSPEIAHELVMPRKPTGFRPPVNHHGVEPETRLSA